MSIDRVATRCGEAAETFARMTPDSETVCLWWTDLGWADQTISVGRDLLSTAEQDRAARFKQYEHTKHFIAARAAVRMILSRYLRVDPASVAFSSNSHGKPSLTDDWADQRIEFNLAHSTDIAVFAVTIGRRVGTDLERIRQNVSCLEIARKFFAAEEANELSLLANDDLVREFYHYWTLKEAWAKAIGQGLSVPLERLKVPASKHNRPWIVQDPFSPAQRWALYDVSPNEHVAAAVVAEAGAHPPQILQAHFNEMWVR